jgi:hypothetical protein
MLDDDNLKNKMIYESILIIQSLEWVEKEIKKTLILIDEAEKRSYKKELEKLEKILKTLCNRLEMEDRNMAKFLVKYKRLIDHEKEKMLSNPRKKK